MATIISIRQDMTTLPVMICSRCSKLCLTTIRLSVLDLAAWVAAESDPALETVRESPDCGEGTAEGLVGEDGEAGVVTAPGACATGAERIRIGRAKSKRRRAA
jgi:hypothetical protein